MSFFFFATANTHIYTLSLHDALPISNPGAGAPPGTLAPRALIAISNDFKTPETQQWSLEIAINRSEEHTSELQSLAYLVCRLLLEKKNASSHQLIDAGVRLR